MTPTLLTVDQIFGNKALSVIKQYGIATGASDLAVILGACMYSNAVDLENNASTSWWSASASNNGGVLCVYKGENDYGELSERRRPAVRPALPPSLTSVIGASAARPTRKIHNIQIVEYGEYPQSALGAEDAIRLERMRQNGLLRTTGKKYTFDTVDLYVFGTAPCFAHYEEYTDGNTRYVRVRGQKYDADSRTRKGIYVQSGEMYWLRVEPIEWLVDPSGWWVAKDCLFAGIRFNPDVDYDGNFDKTEMAAYIKNYFANQMMCDGRGSVTNDDTRAQGFAAATRKLANSITIIDEPMSVTEQIKFYVDTGKSFMLHGPSGIGKTARIEAVDPNLTAIPLWNGVLPEDVVGKVRYPNGAIEPLMTPNEMGNMATEKLNQGGVWVAPDWYNELVRKCNAEPNRMHVLFIDEVTNAKPTTQSLIFHIVLKKSISPSQGQLPKNAVVVLAGNEREDSGAAYNMPAPLFRRMSGHIRLKPDLREWLKWATQKSGKSLGDKQRQNIHPLVAQFVACNPELFYSAYDEEEPTEWTIDPRGWAQVSDIIYDNKNVLRRELLENKIGAFNAKALLSFACTPILSLEDVLSGNYDPSDIPRNMDQRTAMALGLQNVDERNVGVVRDFIRKYLGAENLAMFDSVWTSDSPERAIQIATEQMIINQR